MVIGMLRVLDVEWSPTCSDPLAVESAWRREEPGAFCGDPLAECVGVLHKFALVACLRCKVASGTSKKIGGCVYDMTPPPSPEKNKEGVKRGGTPH